MAILCVSNRHAAVILLEHDRLVDQTVLHRLTKENSWQFQSALFFAGGGEDINFHGY
jgi:hypothetical protein